MEYIPPISETNIDPQAGYIDENLAAGIEGSCVPANAVEHPMREIVHCIKQAGLTPDESDLTQLWQAMVSRELKSGPDNTYLGSQNGETVWRPWPFGQAVANDVVWFVRPDGNDETAKAIVNADIHGSENTPEKAFKTVSAAVNHFTKNYYVTGLGAITIQLGVTGTYTEPAWVNFTTASSLSLQPFPLPPLDKRSRARYTISGDKNNRGAYVWSMPSNPSFSTVAAQLGNWSCEGLSIVTTGARTTYGVSFVGSGGRLWNTNVTSPAANIVVSSSSVIIVGTCNITATGGAAAAFYGSTSTCAIIIGDWSSGEANTTITLNCPTAGSTSILVHTLARAEVTANTIINGTVNGTKYIAIVLSYISTNGRLATIAGTAAGVVEYGSVAL